MPRLKKLMFIIPGPHVKSFADPITRSRLLLPDVDVLVVGPSCSIVTRICPSVSVLAQGHPFGNSMIDRKMDKFTFLESQSILPNVTTLELHQYWNLGLLRLILRIFPSLKYLGEVRPDMLSHSMNDLIVILNQFERLESLAIAHPYCLSQSSGPGPRKCRKAYPADRIHAEHTTAASVKSSCPKLRELWIGEYSRVEIVEKADGPCFTWFRGEARKDVAPVPELNYSRRR